MSERVLVEYPEELAALAREAIGQVFREGFQDQPHAEEKALGILLARYAGYDCRRLFEVVYAAMEDANMHTENAALVTAAKTMGVLKPEEFY